MQIPIITRCFLDLEGKSHLYRFPSAWVAVFIRGRCQQWIQNYNSQHYWSDNDSPLMLNSIKEHVILKYLDGRKQYYYNKCFQCFQRHATGMVHKDQWTSSQCWNGQMPVLYKLSFWIQRRSTAKNTVQSLTNDTTVVWDRVRCYYCLFGPENDAVQWYSRWWWPLCLRDTWSLQQSSFPLLSSLKCHCAMNWLFLYSDFYHAYLLVLALSVSRMWLVLTWRDFLTSMKCWTVQDYYT